MSSPPSSSGAARLKVCVGYGLAVLVLGFTARYLGLNFSAFIAAMKGLSPVAMLFAFGAFLVQIAINAFAFASLNHALGVSSPSTTLARIWAGTLLTKYVPGGIWHVVGRGIVLARLGVSARTTFLAGIAEQSISLLLCTLLAALFFLYGIASSAPQKATAAVVALAAIATFAVGLHSAGRGVHKSKLARAALAYAIAMIPYALGYLLVLSPELPARFLAALFAGTVAGVLAIPVPGGLGIRESVTSFLAAPINPPQVLAGLLSARALIFGAELLASSVNVSALRGKAAL